MVAKLHLNGNGIVYVCLKVYILTKGSEAKGG